MLCSVPAGKSGSNWLDRLRSNKGFQTGDEELDLDHFLTQNPSPSSSDSPHSNCKSIPPNTQGVIINRSEISRRAGAQNKEWFGIMSNVLSELFYMGGSDESSRLSGKRIPRKQTKPRLCVMSTRNNSSNSNTSVIEKKKSLGFVRKGVNALAATASLNSDSNSLVVTKAGNVDVDGNEDDDEEEEEGEKGERELKGYSRSEVTVIDTSCGLWKSEKLVFRRRNVWKVREKKGKFRGFGRKKRKDNDNGVVVVVGGGGGKKKAKVLASEEDNAEQCATPSTNEGNNLKNDSREEVCKATANNLDTAKEEVSKDLKKRFPFSRSPKKMRKGGSAVVLIKGIPTDKKNGSKLSNNISKGTHRQLKV